MRSAAAALPALLAVAVAAGAQPPGVDFSGTWVLDRAASRIDPDAGLARLGDGGVPARLHVTHAANGDLTLLSEVNESQARTYKLGVESPIPVSQDVDLPVTARWEGTRFIAEGSRAAGGVTAVQHVLTLGPDGALTIDAATTAGGRERRSVLVYTRTGEVPPCAEWSTPCPP